MGHGVGLNLSEPFFNEKKRWAILCGVGQIGYDVGQLIFMKIHEKGQNPLILAFFWSWKSDLN